MRDVILASQSPRRQELLKAMGVRFKAVVSGFEERLDSSRPVDEIARELGLGKALAVAEHYPEAIVIGSDTIVAIDGMQLEKPADVVEARQTLRLLSSRTNHVVTSLAVVCLAGNIRRVLTDTAKVHFKPYVKADHEAYIASGDYQDKAGSYGIQSGAAPLIEYMSGNYDAVVGLPTHLLAPLLVELGIAAKAVDLPSPIAVR